MKWGGGGWLEESRERKEKKGWSYETKREEYEKREEGEPLIKARNRLREI